MTFEERVQDALRVVDTFQPSPDLFVKVRRSIEEDAAHRRRVRGVVAALGLGVLVLAGFILATGRLEGGRFELPFWALELAITVVMVVVVVVMGPAIRRFGEQYEQAVFHAAPATGTRFLRLLDVAYYLLFGAYTLMTLQFDPAEVWRPVGHLGVWVENELVRLGGLLLLMGILHAVLLLLLPVVGLVFSSNERRARRAVLGAGAPAATRLANRVDRVVTVLAWAIAALVAFQLVTTVIEVVLIGAGGP